MKRYTCYDADGNRLPDAIEGTREEALAWMKARFGRVRRKSDDRLPAWAFFFTCGNASPYSIGKGREAYLIELDEVAEGRT